MVVIELGVVWVEIVCCSICLFCLVNVGCG